MSKKLLLKKIEVVKVELAEATENLDMVLREIKIAPRAEKVAISAVVRDAFEKLRAAQAELEELETLLSKEV